jgi:glutathione synthase/RimK-type ligase-like ATP-grasp enzyme
MAFRLPDAGDTMSAYPAQTRYIARACAKLGFSFTDLDNGGGYLFVISDGAHEIVSGAGGICAFPLNAAPAFGISKDKYHTNAVLKRAGLPVIESALFFLTPEYAKLREPGREIEDAIAAFDRMPKPVFAKPNQGARGNFAEVVTDAAAFRDYLERVRARFDTVLLQPVVDGSEHRVFCLDDRAVFATRKADFSLEGDGCAPLVELIRTHNANLKGTGISTVDEKATLAAIAARHGLDGADVPANGERIILPGRRNLSAGSDVADFTTDVPQRLADVALKAMKAIGLRVAGVDVFDVSPARDLSDLVVIEVNGNPGMQSLEAIGRDDLIDDIWSTILTRTFAEFRT